MYGNEQRLEELDALLIVAPKDLGFAAPDEHAEGLLEDLGVHAVELCQPSSVSFHARG